MKTKIEDTYSEASDGIYSRLIITAKNRKNLERIVYNVTALPSIVLGRTEGGLEKWLDEDSTPDGRIGAILQFWGILDRKDPNKYIERFYKELSYRIRQGILVMPTSRVFNATESSNKMDSMERIGHCGDGYEHEDEIYGRKVIIIPIMMGDFIIERYLGYNFGVMGASLWFMCKDEDAAIKIGELAISAIEKIIGVVTPFYICSAGSKPQSKYPEIGPTTNHLFCPTLKYIVSFTKVPEEVNSISEVVINGISIEAIKEAMKVAINTTKEIEGLVMISAGNYEGKIGKYKIYLKDVIK